MKIKLITIGKTDDNYLKEGINIYLNRLKHYIKFEIIEISNIKLKKKISTNLQKEAEGKELLKLISTSDFLILMDEKGTAYDSVKFATFIQKRMNTGLAIVFVIGGAFGFSEALYSRADAKIALSPMTFSHQMVRLFFVEQLYRCFTILKGEKYHHF